MAHIHPQHATPPSRRGVVLLAVLVVIVLLSLAVYSYSDLAFAEYKAADQAQRQAQALALANSGVHYAMALLSNPDAMASTLNGNPYNNPTAFSHVPVTAAANGGYSGTFSILAPPDPTDSSGTIRFGVIDESGKINVNAWMNIDSKGQALLSVLQQLPNMTEATAGAIVDWLDADDTPQTTGGAESDYYSTLNPPYYPRNGNIDSLEELLLVQGVTPDFLFGQYRNPYFGLPVPGAAAASGNPGAGNTNNQNNSTNNSSSGGNTGGGNNNSSSSNSNNSAAGAGVASTIDLGWSGHLTMYSREQNVDLYGKPLINLNDTDLTNLVNNLTDAGIDQTVINFIILYRQNGSSGGGGGNGSGSGSGSNSGSNSSSSSNSSGSGSSSSGATGNLSQVTIDPTQAGNTQIKSIFDLVNAKITLSGAAATAAMGGSNNQGGGSNNSSNSSSNASVTFASPFSDQAMLQEWLPALYEISTLQQGTDIPARVNINIASPEVLQALANVSSSGFNATDIQNILSNRPTYTAGQPLDSTYSTPVWLITQAGLSASKLSAMDKYITTRSQVYRIHSLGVLDAQGQTARVEAVIDTNGGQPRIISWRNLTQLGKGVSKAQLQQAGGQ